MSHAAQVLQATPGCIVSRHCSRRSCGFVAEPTNCLPPTPRIAGDRPGANRAVRRPSRWRSWTFDPIGVVRLMDTPPQRRASSSRERRNESASASTSARTDSHEERKDNARAASSTACFLASRSLAGHFGKTTGDSSARTSVTFEIRSVLLRPLFSRQFDRPGHSLNGA